MAGVGEQPQVRPGPHIRPLLICAAQAPWQAADPARRVPALSLHAPHSRLVMRRGEFGGERWLGERDNKKLQINSQSDN